MLQRRTLLLTGLALPLGARSADAAASDLLREGGVVLALRHALAPGTFDPPEFRLGDCSTQRNLNDEGRAQARRVGDWFIARQLKPVRVRSSPGAAALTRPSWPSAAPNPGPRWARRAPAPKPPMRRAWTRCAWRSVPPRRSAGASRSG